MKNIIAHRGFWLETSEQNTKVAFNRALSYGFGIETDLRDRNQSIVISHDMSTSESMKIEDFFALFHAAPNVTLALNVKADGLQNTLETFIPTNFHFYFDMSVPDMLGYLKRNMNVYTRYSDIEYQPALIDKCKGVWLDNFKDEKLDEVALKTFLKLGKNVVLVSPELHKRNYLEYWNQLKSFLNNNTTYKAKVGLCTDYPLDARSFFNEH
jgi:glycerophosphoryl diester phosphodiesterase